MVTLTPIRPSSSIIVVTSCRCGTLPTETGPSASSVAARIGNAAFLAPEIRTSPSSGVPPCICSLSMACGDLLALVGRVRLDAQGVDLATHTGTKGRVDQLVTLERPLARKLRCDDHGLEMGVIVGSDLDARAGQSGGDHGLDFC